jgi:hypothetical protein
LLERRSHGVRVTSGATWKAVKRKSVVRRGISVSLIRDISLKGAEDPEFDHAAITICLKGLCDDTLQKADISIMSVSLSRTGPLEHL